MSGSTKVFILDNNTLIRFALVQLLESQSDLVVVGDHGCNEEAFAQIKKAKPDILIFDIPMPREKGLEMLKSLSKFRLPIIVFTKSDKNIAEDLIPLLEAGAVGFVLKPASNDDITEVKEQLLHEIKINKKKKAKKKTSTSKSSKKVSFFDPLRVVAIGSSTGGPEALATIMPQFPANFPAGIAIVQHMPPKFTTKFAQRLNGKSQIAVKEAQEGDVMKPGLALLAPGDFHMVFKESRQGQRHIPKVVLTKDPPQWKLRPTVDKMMTSLAPMYKTHIIGVILTGMGEDGVVGMRAIKQNGGRTLVQNKSSSVVYGMGQQVVKNNLADKVLPLTQIVPEILKMLK